MSDQPKSIVQELQLKIDGAKSIRDLKQTLREIRNAMVEVGEESDQFERLARAASRAQDEIDGINQNIRAFDPDNKFAAMQQAAQGIAVGVQLATSAMALFGSESEEVQKIMMRVQAAMAFSQAIAQIGEMKDAFNAFNTAVKANPILGVAAAIIALTTAAVGLYNALKQDSEEMKAANAEMERTKELAETLVPEYKRQEELAQAQGKTLKEVNEIRRKSIEVQTLEAEASARASIQRIKEVVENDSVYESILRKSQAIAEFTGEQDKVIALEAMIQKNKQERAEEDIKNAEEQLNNIKDFRNQLKVLDAQENKEAQDNYKEYVDGQKTIKEKEMQLRRSYANERIKIEQSLNDEVGKLWDAQTLANAENEADRIERERKQAIADFENRNKALKDTENYYIGLQLLNAKYNLLAKAEADRQTEENQALMDAVFAEEQAAQDARLKSKLDAEIATEKAIADAKVMFRQSAFSILNSIADLEINNENKQKKIKKNIALAELAIDTAKAIGSMTREAADAAAKAQAITPVPGAGALFYVGYYAARLATIMKNVSSARRLLSTETGEAIQADSGGGGSTPTIQTPSLFTPQTPPQQTALGGTGQQQQQQQQSQQLNTQPLVMRAYVVERDITNSQNTSTQYEQLATFTG